MRGVLSATGGNPASLIEKARNIPSMAGLDLASAVSTRAAYEWNKGVDACSPSELVGRPDPAKHHVVAYDFGIKRNILRRLVQVGCRVTVVPALTSAEDVLALKPDGVFLSNGPGDPEPLRTQVGNVQRLIGKVPIFGICLGNQILGLAMGGKTYKMKFGHRGANHPVINKSPTKSRSLRTITGSPWIPIRSTRANARSRTSISTTRRSKASGCAITPCSACSIIPKPLPARTTRATCLTIS